MAPLQLALSLPLLLWLAGVLPRARGSAEGATGDLQLHHLYVPRMPKPGRTLLIGDVHGCLPELEALLAAASFDPARDNLVFVGDLVRKGPDSPGVVRLARKLQAFAVRGNHDEVALASGRGAAAAVENWTEGLSDEDLAWLRSRPYTLRLAAHGVLAVHGGLVPGKSLAGQQLSAITTMRNLVKLNGDGGSGDWNATKSTEAGRAWAAAYDELQQRRLPALEHAARSGTDASATHAAPAGGALLGEPPWHVVFGHDAARQLQRYRWVTGLDTGCVYGFGLTALVLQPGQRLDADISPELAPLFDPTGLASEVKSAAAFVSTPALREYVAPGRRRKQRQEL